MKPRARHIIISFVVIVVVANAVGFAGAAGFCPNSATTPGASAFSAAALHFYVCTCTPLIGALPRSAFMRDKCNEDVNMMNLSLSVTLLSLALSSTSPAMDMRSKGLNPNSAKSGLSGAAHHVAAFLRPCGFTAAGIAAGSADFPRKNTR
jgi:hypothetical protein